MSTNSATGDRTSHLTAMPAREYAHQIKVPVPHFTPLEGESIAFRRPPHARSGRCSLQYTNEDGHQPLANRNSGCGRVRHAHHVMTAPDSARVCSPKLRGLSALVLFRHFQWPQSQRKVLPLVSNSDRCKICRLEFGFKIRGLLAVSKPEVLRVPTRQAPGVGTDFECAPNK